MKAFAKLSVLAVLAASSVAVAHAGSISYDFSYAGSGVTASGVLTTSSAVDPLHGGYDITGITGLRNGVAIAGVILTFGPGVTSSYMNGIQNRSYDNVFYPGAAYPLQPFDVYGLLFETQGGARYNLFSQFSSFTSSAIDEATATGTEPVEFAYSLVPSPVPEPSTLLLLGTGLFALAGGLFFRMHAA